MSLANLTQAERLHLGWVEPVVLVHIVLDGKTLYLSDRDFRYNYGAGVDYYESFLAEVSGLDQAIFNGGGGPNSSLTLSLFNQKTGAYDYLSEMQGDYDFVGAGVEVYEVRLVEPYEAFASDVKVCLWKGNIERVHSITRTSLEIDCSSRIFSRNESLGLKKVSADDFPSADPDDIGKYRNQVYGAVKNVPCRAVKAGALDTLRDDLTSGATSFYVSLSSKANFPSGTVTVQIDDEQIQGTYNQATGQFTSCTRGYNSTTATEHDAGASVAEVLTEYVYEVASHPVKSIGDVRVDGVKQTSGCTAYTGQSGDELTGYAGTAVIKFTALPKIVKQVNIEADIDEGTHTHTAVGTSTVTMPDVSHDDPRGVWSDEANARDGDEDTYASCTMDENDSLGIKFQRTSLGAMSSVRVKIVYSSDLPTSSSELYVQIGGAKQYFEGTGGVANKTTIFKTFSCNDWTFWVYFNMRDVWLPRATRVYEISAIATYGLAVAAGPAEGVLVTLSGNSSADTVIGRDVVVDVEGYQDDGTGTYTGTANALIERPDHVFKHILCGLLGFSSTDLGTSFSTSGAAYASAITGGYAFAFIPHEIANQADRLLSELARQCRSDFTDRSGLFELLFNSDSTPTAALALSDDDLAAEPVFEFTDRADIANHLNGHYDRDYSQFGSLGDQYNGLKTASQSPADVAQDVELSAIRSEAMAAHVLAWMLDQSKDVLVQGHFECKWRAISLGPGKIFSLAWDLYDGTLFKVLEFEPDRASGIVNITGIEVPTT